MKKLEKYAIAAIEYGGAALLIIEGVVLSLMALGILVVALIDSESMFDLVFGLTASGVCGFLSWVIFSVFKSNK